MDLVDIEKNLASLSNEECGLKHHLVYFSDDDAHLMCDEQKRVTTLGCLHNGDVVLRDCVRALEIKGLITKKRANAIIDELNHLLCDHGTSALANDWKHLYQVRERSDRTTDEDLLESGRVLQRPILKRRLEIRDELLGIARGAIGVSLHQRRIELPLMQPDNGLAASRMRVEALLATIDKKPCGGEHAYRGNDDQCPKEIKEGVLYCFHGYDTVIHRYIDTLEAAGLITNEEAEHIRLELEEIRTELARKDAIAEAAGEGNWWNGEEENAEATAATKSRLIDEQKVCVRRKAAIIECLLSWEKRTPEAPVGDASMRLPEAVRA